MSFFPELRHGKVVKVAAACAVVSWLLLHPCAWAGDWPSPVDDRYQARDAARYGQYKQAQGLIDQYSGQSRLLSDAQKLLMPIIQADPGFAPAYYELARVVIIHGYIRDGQFSEGSVETAASLIEQALRIESEYAEAHCLLGHLYTKSGDYARAESAMTRCESIGTASPWLDLNWADLLVKQGKPEEARVRYLKVLAEGTTSSKARNVALTGVRRYYEKRGEYAEADKWYRKGLEWDPDSAWNWGNYAAFQLYSLGDEEAAIVSAERALAIMDYGRGRKTLACALYSKWARGQEQGQPEPTLDLLFARASEYLPDVEAAAKTLGTYASTRFAATALYRKLGTPSPYGPGDAPLRGMYDTKSTRSARGRAVQDPIALWKEGVAAQDASLRFHKMTKALELWSESSAPLAALEYIDVLPPGPEQTQFRSMALSNAAVSEPEMMLERLDQFPAPQEQRQILTSAMSQLGQVNGRAAVERAHRFYSADRKQMALQAAYSGWARTDVLAASRHYAAMPEWAEFAAAGQAILEIYMNADEAGALAWVTGLEGPGGALLWSRAMTRIAAYRPEDALAILDETPLSPATQRGVENVLTSMAQSHPQIAAEYSERLPVGQLRAGTAMQAVNRWAEQDPLSAFEWTVRQPPLIQQGIYRGLIPRLAKSDLQFVLDIPIADLPPEVRSNWVSGVLAACAATDFERAESWLLQYEGEPYYERGLNQLIMALARQDPPAALNRLIVLPDSRQARSQVEMVVSIWATKDPPSAADWVLANLPSDERIGLFQAVLRPWNRLDPASAERWATSLRDPIERDSAITVLHTLGDP